jgi:hypothetical protein
MLDKIEVIEVEVVPTRYCKPFKMDIEVETCRTRCKEIKKQFDKEGLLSLMKEQKKCYGCGDGIGQKSENEANDNLNSGGKVMSGAGLSKLNKALFDQLDRMNNPELKGDALSQEIERTKAIAEIGKQVINTGRLALDAIKTVGAARTPGFLELEDKGSN